MMKSEYINCKNCKDDCRCRGKNITPICVSFTPAKTTNADRIRAMTDEKLAEFLDGVKSDWWDGIVPVTVIDSKNMFDSNDILEWLKEESKDD